MNTAYFFFADSKEMGLTSHFSRQVVNMFESPARTADFYVVSDQKEAPPRCWELVRKHVPERFIVEYDESNFAEMRSRLEALLENYANAVFHIQGVNRIHNLKPLLRSPKVNTVVTVHSFAHGIWWKRPIVSFVYALQALRYVNKIIFTCPFSKNLFWGAEFLKNPGKSSTFRSRSLTRLASGTPAAGTASTKRYFPVFPSSTPMPRARLSCSPASSAPRSRAGTRSRCVRCWNGESASLPSLRKKGNESALSPRLASRRRRRQNFSAKKF